jgi:hypothetical protein
MRSLSHLAIRGRRKVTDLKILANSCIFYNIESLSVDSLSNYENIKEYLPKLETLQIDLKDLQCPEIKKIYCDLRKQMIQLESVEPSLACGTLNTYIKSTNTIFLEDIEFNEASTFADHAKSHWNSKYN